MKNRSLKSHHMDAIFPITLFFVMTIFALMVIALAAGIYENTTERSHRNHQSRIALSYISEKVHQNDADSVISIRDFQGVDALTFVKTYHESNYYTYLYYYDGALRELFAKEGVETSLSDGKVILELLEFTMEEVADGLYYFTCTDYENQAADSYVSITD